MRKNAKKWPVFHPHRFNAKSVNLETYARTLLYLMCIRMSDFVMIGPREHSQKSVTDGRTHAGGLCDFLWTKNHHTIRVMISSKLCDCEFGQDITWFLWWFVVFHTKYSHTSFPKFLRKSKTCVNQICVMNLNWIMWLSFHFLPLEKRYCVTVHYTYLNVKIIT